MHVDVAAIEECHNEDGAEVIGYGKGCEEHLERDGHAVAEDGHDTDGKGDVGGCGDSPTSCGGGAEIEECVEEGRDCHSTCCRNDGQEGFLHAGEFATDDFTLDFEPDGEEEDDHEDVVDELLDSHVLRETDGEGLVGDGHGEAGLQKFMIVVCREWQVCQEHGNDDAYKQGDSSCPWLLTEIGL